MEIILSLLLFLGIGFIALLALVWLTFLVAGIELSLSSLARSEKEEWEDAIDFLE